MLNRSVRHILVAANVVMCFAAGAKVHAQTATPRSAAPNKETRVTRATGSFDVKLNPLTAYNDADGALLGRFSIDKQIRGDLEATSKGEMLTAGGSVKNSAGYVAVERVTGTLHGRGGSFALMHTGVMTRGDGKLTITVVPDSGTGDLAGISGSMNIIITDGKHLYEFDYVIAAVP